MLVIQPWESGKILEIETNRLIVRSMTPQDINKDYLSWWNSPEIQDGLNMPPRNWSKFDAVRHISSFNNIDRFHLGIYRKEQGLIGFCALFYSPERQTATVNLVIGNKHCWGKGFPKESALGVFEFAFECLKISKMKTEVVDHNRSSIASCLSIGFIREGVLRAEKPHYRSGRVDLHLFGMLKEEWEGIKQKGFPENRINK